MKLGHPMSGKWVALSSSGTQPQLATAESASTDLLASVDRLLPRIRLARHLGSEPLGHKMRSRAAQLMFLQQQHFNSMPPRIADPMATRMPAEGAPVVVRIRLLRDRVLLFNYR